MTPCRVTDGADVALHRAAAHGVPRSMAGAWPARKVIGCEPVARFREGLTRALPWYKENL